MTTTADIAYVAAAAATAPVWLWRLITTGKIRTDWKGRFGRLEALPETRRPRVLIHAVSVGEVNACRLLVERLASATDAPEVVIASTTNTGFARARALFGQSHAVVRYPFDLSSAVNRFLDAVRPDVVALIELEVWPNLVRLCKERGIPVAVINGRISDRGIRRYRLVRRLVAPSFAGLDVVAVQNETYAERFRELGASPHDVVVSGTMKWDTAEIADEVSGSAALAESMGIDRSRPLVVAGSTAPGEHALLHGAVSLGTQLLCAPRKPEWFEQAARELPGCARRSRGDRGSTTDRFLLDSIGELRAAYALADVVVVGRTFDPLGGSDMMEPVALGKATVVGPHTENFVDTAGALEDGGGLVRTSAEKLASCLRALIEDPDRRAALAAAGREVIRVNQGATDRHVELLLSLLPGRSMSPIACTSASGSAACRGLRAGA